MIQPWPPLPLAPRRRQVIANPLARRLMRRAGCLAGWPAIGLAALFCLWVDYDLFFGLITGGPSNWWIRGGYGVLAFSVPLSVAIFVPVMAGNLAANYRRSPEYELVCATALSNGQLAWAYVAAALYRCRALLVAALGVAPLVAADHFGPFQARLGGALPETELGRWLALTAMVVVGLLGAYVLLACLTVALYLRWGFSAPAQGAAVALTVSVWLLSDAGLRQLSAWGLASNRLVELAGAAGVALLPYALAAGGMALARAWARSPVRPPLI